MNWLERLIEWVFKLIFGEPQERPKIPPELKIPPSNPEDPKKDPQQPSEPTREAYLKCTRINAKTSTGLDVLKLELYSGYILVKDWPVVSGISGRQNFKLPRDSKAGSFEPLPQGKYKIGAPDWHGKPYDWEDKHDVPGIGAFWQSITPQFVTERGDFGIHLDDNMKSSPGSKGCITFQDKTYMEGYIHLYEKYKPSYLICDWGLNEATTKAPKKICLEIGHGPYIDERGGKGFETGANGPEGFTEYEGNQIQAKAAKTALENLGYSVTVLDVADTLMGLGKRSEGHDVFVSMHENSFNKTVQGSEVYVHPDGTPEDSRLAESILKEVVYDLKTKDRGVKASRLSVLAGVPKSVKAAVLTEPFFVDVVLTKQEAEEMSRKAGMAIARGIHLYLSHS